MKIILDLIYHFSTIIAPKFDSNPRYSRLSAQVACLESLLNDVVQASENNPKVKKVLTDYSDFYNLKIAEHKNKFKI